MELYLEELKTTLLNKYMCTYYDSKFHYLVIHLREIIHFCFRKYL